MSKYLHFGQLSPVWIALQIKGQIKRQIKGQQSRRRATRTASSKN